MIKLQTTNSLANKYWKTTNQRRDNFPNENPKIFLKLSIESRSGTNDPSDPQTSTQNRQKCFTSYLNHSHPNTLLHVHIKSRERERKTKPKKHVQWYTAAGLRTAAILDAYEFKSMPAAFVCCSGVLNFKFILSSGSGHDPGTDEKG